MKYLVVIDMQKDFIDGALGTKEAVAIVDDVKAFIDDFDGEVIFTRDTHQENYLQTQEGKNLPVVHCIENTEGWQIDAKLNTEGRRIFNKPTFGSVALMHYLASKSDIEEIVLCGVCTDICVISNALLIKAALPEVPVSVVEKCCAGVSVESHNNALAAMKMCQIAVK